MADLKVEAQLLGARVEQENGKNLVINDPLHHFSNAVEQGVEVKRGVKNVRDFNQQRLDINTGRGRNCS